MGLFDSIFGKEKVWQYSATLSINTPKYILEKHDEVVRSKSEPKLLGEPTGYNKFDGNKPYNNLGIWCETTDYALEGGHDSVPDLIGVPTEIGRLKQKSKALKDWISYLIDFRTIVESDMSIEEKLYQINDVMSQSSEEYKSIYKKLVTQAKFPDDFFKNQLSTLNGVSSKTAGLLWDAGYLSPEAVKNAPEEELLKLKGIGKALVKKIKIK
mgnify:FL=1